MQVSGNLAACRALAYNRRVRHIEQKRNADCGIACIAMVAGLSLKQAYTYTPKLDYDNEGMWMGQILTALRKATRRAKTRWKLYKRTYPMPFRHWTPRIARGILLIVKLSNAANPADLHVVAYDGYRILDPSAKKLSK